jgi:hypothetical protein
LEDDVAKRRRAAPTTADSPPPSRERAERLLRLLRADVGGARRGEFLDLAADALALAVADPRAHLSLDGDDYAVVLQDVPAYIKRGDKRGTEHITPEDMTLPDRAFMERFQTTVRAGMESLDSGKDWSPFAKQEPPQWALHRRADGTVGRGYHGPLMPVLIASATDLLLEWWPQIRRCAYEPCRAFFIPTHGRQEHHAPLCSTRNGNNNHQRLKPRENDEKKERRVGGKGPGRGRTRRKS